MFKRKMLAGIGLMSLSLLSACGGGGGSNGASNFPNKTVTVVVHTEPGGGADLFARTLAPVLSKKLGASVVVVNKSGGSSTNALNYVVRQKPDGYTLVAMTDTFLVNPLLNKTQFDYTDMTPVSRMLIDPMVVYVRADSKLQSLEEMMTELKTHHMKLGVPQAGSVESIVITALIQKYHPKIDVATYEDGGQALLGVLSGDIAVAVAEAAEVIAQVEAKKVRILGTFTSERSPALPDVPTFKETGYDAVIDKFRGISGPSDMPAAVVKTLESALKSVSADDGYQKSLAHNMQIPGYMPSNEFGEFIKSQASFYKQSLK